MNLTDNDKREIIQLIQDNKPLPEKYRFLLFKKREEIELLWNGKSNSTTNITLPFQIIEHVDEPREEKEIKLQGDLFDESGRQLRGWSNKLIWGNNNLILSSLIHGNLSEEINKEGGIKTIYIDPPFNVGDDFHINIEISGNKFEKKRNLLEEIAYRDTWGKGSDSFISMIYERLLLMRSILSDDGSIFVHSDYRVSYLLRQVLNEIFGEENFVNEIIWTYQRPAAPNQQFFSRVHDTIFWFKKSNNYKFYPDQIRVPHDKKTVDNFKKGLKGSGFGDTDLNVGGKIPEDWWLIAPAYKSTKETLKYPTQKPEKLLERIIFATTEENDIVADFFCGSGTTLAVAEKLNRKWIGSDLGKFAIHTTRKRMIKVQREKKSTNKDFRAFEILNLGKYQRESFISANNDKMDKEKYFIDLILKAYGAEKIDNPILHGVKNSKYVYIGPINIHVSRKAVETVVKECQKNSITRVDILCFDHEQGLFPNIINESKEKGVEVSCKIIPPDVFDKRAIDKKQIVFHDVAFIEFKTKIKKKKLSVQLTGFSVDYSQEKIDEILGELKPNRSRVILSNGQIIKVSRDKNGIEKKDIVTKSWKDWIDYWAVDFDFENKKEIFKEKDENGNIVEKWSGDYIFENEWQSFRNQGSDMEFESAEKEIIGKSSVKVAVKVVDIFGNDTMKVIKVNI